MLAFRSPCRDLTTTLSSAVTEIYENLFTKSFNSAAERAGDPSAAADQEGDAVRGADDAQAAGTNLHRQLADAAAAEKDMLRRLECEIRR